MSPLIHLIVSWLIAILLFKDLKDRRILIFCGIIADIDGVFILVSSELFNKFHHGFGHSLVFGIPLAIVLCIFSSNKAKVILGSILVFVMHLVLDIIGSAWPINPFYPFSDLSLSIYPYLSGNMIYWVLDPIFAVFVIVLMVRFVTIYRKSPMEFLSIKLDKVFTGFFVYPLKHKCKVSCHKPANYHCDVCGGYFCPRHVNKYFATKCSNCEAKTG